MRFFLGLNELHKKSQLKNQCIISYEKLWSRDASVKIPFLVLKVSLLFIVPYYMNITNIKRYINQHKFGSSNINLSRAKKFIVLKLN